MIRSRAKSFDDAFRGFSTLIGTQTNARIHLVATLGVFGVGLYLGVSRFEWCLLVLAITVVWAAEAFNTAIEFLSDAVTLERHPRIGRAKDIAAGGVLLSAIGAAVVGALVFYPYLGLR